MPVNTTQTKRKVKSQTNKVRSLLREHKKDNKYKTEMCKTFSLTGRCPYNEKCRFAHGDSELFDKEVDSKLYKKKTCASFAENGFCNYGLRCHFKHEVESSFGVGFYLTLLESYKPFQKPLKSIRLNVFRSIKACFLPETDTESPAVSRKTSVDARVLKGGSYSFAVPTENGVETMGELIKATLD